MLCDFVYPQPETQDKYSESGHKFKIPEDPYPQEGLLRNVWLRADMTQSLSSLIIWILSGEQFVVCSTVVIVIQLNCCSDVLPTDIRQFASWSAGFTLDDL